VSHNPYFSFPNPSQLGAPPYGSWKFVSHFRLLFLEMLKFIYILSLPNNSISYNTKWHLFPTKIPLNIPNFEGKSTKYTIDHMITFHVWCSKNFLPYYSIRMRIFQRTVFTISTEWYIELKGDLFKNFNYLAIIFLNHFQLHICYDVETEMVEVVNKHNAYNMFKYIQE